MCKSVYWWRHKVKLPTAPTLPKNRSQQQKNVSILRATFTTLLLPISLQHLKLHNTDTQTGSGKGRHSGHLWPAKEFWVCVCFPALCMTPADFTKDTLRQKRGNAGQSTSVSPVRPSLTWAKREAVVEATGSVFRREVLSLEQNASLTDQGCTGGSLPRGKEFTGWLKSAENRSCHPSLLRRLREALFQMQRDISRYKTVLSAYPDTYSSFWNYSLLWEHSTGSVNLLHCLYPNISQQGSFINLLFHPIHLPAQDPVFLLPLHVPEGW